MMDAVVLKETQTLSCSKKQQFEEKMGKMKKKNPAIFTIGSSILKTLIFDQIFFFISDVKFA